MTGLIIFLCIVLIAILVVQIGRVSELSGALRGGDEKELDSNKWNGVLSIVFVVLFLVGCVISAGAYKDVMLGYGPWESSSEHGFGLDYLFNITLFFTGIVFVATHLALFYFAYKYRGRPGHTGTHISHNNSLEIIWSAIPALVMTFLVVSGLVEWNKVMADVGIDEEFIEIEATGIQYNWLLRYGGPDGTLGERNYKKITATNPLGQDWMDTKNLDDFSPDKIVLPVGKKVRVRIMARDVLHNFYLPHFRVKMDAIPGLPTYFVFTPTKTTAQMRSELSEYDDWNVPADPDDPEGDLRWEAFEYELACAELCGKGHYSMRRIVEIVEEDEYEAWKAVQPSWYMQNVRNSDEDPYVGMLLDVELGARKDELRGSFESAMIAESEEEKIVRLNYVNFETGSANLTANSKYELDNVIELLSSYKELRIELGGHTDNVGDASANQSLSQARAEAVRVYLRSNGVLDSRLRAVGYGQTRPVESNDTAEGRAQNRRTEFKILGN